VALVLVFHGGGSSGIAAARLTQFTRIAERERFAVVYPDAWQRNWNDGRAAAKLASQRAKVNDVAFVSALLDAVGRETQLDPARVFATGISNGAIFAHYLAGNLSERIVAIAPVVGGMAEPYAAAFAPSQPVSVLAIQGTDDPLVPYRGGGVVHGRHGRVLSTDGAISMWVRHDACASGPRATLLADGDPGDGCRFESKVWSDCARGTEVELLRGVGMGHTWPGGRQYLPQGVIGRACRDFDAGERIWQFFQAHARLR
jgi:polyhydroxybutyrate depolymerase